MATVLLPNPAPDLEASKVLDTFFTLSPNPFCIAGTDGYLKKVNGAFVQLLDWSEADLLAHPYLHFVHPDDREATRQAMEAQSRGVVMNTFCNRYRTRSGRYVWLSWASKVIPESGLYYGVAKDITREKEQEEQLRLQQQRLRRVNYLAKQGSWEKDLLNGQWWAAEELYELYQVTRSEFPLLDEELFHGWVHPDDKAFVNSQVQKLPQQDHQFYEHRMLLHNGKTIYVQHFVEVVRAAGLPVRINGIVQDITLRKEWELRLELREKRFRSLVQHSYDIICILDLEGHYHYASDSITHNLGYIPEELIGTNALRLVHPDDLPMVVEALTRLQTQDFVDDLAPFRFKSKEGTWHWLEAVGKNMINDPAVHGIVVNTRDVTDKKNLQDKLQQEQEERRITINKSVIKAQEREREQLGRELHDNVNQVLTTIKLYTELAQDSSMDAKLLLQKSAAYLTDCINEIRSISKRLSTPTLGKISLKESIQELVASLNLTEKLTINLQIGVMDKKRISQDVHLGVYRIIQEQLTNVLKHAEATAVSIEIRQNKTELLVCITDNGKGFDTKARRKGIGISNMYGRAENINGCLDIISQPGNGCRLCLYVPN